MANEAGKFSEKPGFLEDTINPKVEFKQSLGLWDATLIVVAA